MCTTTAARAAESIGGMEMTSSAALPAGIRGDGPHVGAAQLVFATAELMAVLDATVVSIMLADHEGAPESVRDQFSQWTLNLPIGESDE